MICNGDSSPPLRCSAVLIRWTVPLECAISNEITHFDRRSKMMIRSATDEVLGDALQARPGTPKHTGEQSEGLRSKPPELQQHQASQNSQRCY